MIATTWGVGQVLLSIIWFTLFFIWVWLLISVFADIFRSHDLSGPAKAIWTIFVIVMPYLGVFVYLLVRGQRMHEHTLAAAQHNEAALRDFIRTASAGPSTADELAKLAALRDSGVIDESEFATLKAKLVSGRVF